LLFYCVTCTNNIKDSLKIVFLSEHLPDKKTDFENALGLRHKLGNCAMKKSLLALAVAAALAAPLAAQADTILYGSARVSIDYNDADPIDGFWDIVNNDSRLGVQGSEDLGGGLSAIYQYEFGVDVTEGSRENFNSNRPKFVGLKGNFGTVTLGTQETPYYHVAGITDIFNSAKTFGSDAWLGGGFALPGQRSGGRELGFIRLDNSILYVSPDFSGFSGEVMMLMDGRINKNQGFSDNIDIWNVALKYSNGPFFAGASYIALEGDSRVVVDPADPTTTFSLDLDQWNVGLGYASGPFSIGFIYEQGTLNSFGLLAGIRLNGVRVGGDDATNYYVTGSYTFGNNVISAAYGQLDPGTQGLDKIDNYIVGYQYNLSKRTRLWAEYIGRSTSNRDFDLTDANSFSFGTRVDF
jgi:predicted porin